jgi:hypothetical protein
MNGVMGGGNGKGKEREWTEFENPYRLKAELNRRDSIRRGGNQIATRSGPVGLGLSFGEELPAPGKGRQEGQKAASFSRGSTRIGGQEAASFGGESKPKVTGMGGQKAAGFGGMRNGEFIDLTSDDDN